ncbi:mitochondrial inner-membrane-bound regulator-domain-containing protein [Chaetomium fimeti]|uniref:Mitochondrial inner-membrane-bound regulator-domain-containing protein n=1 Tax=Chaetomium fimeti TaxID=1854472 RepID=A0AAE0HMA0_9PEZI|nr:mitochondrial inner-membrane-bound regulator-domain-containing protein [Chaetomium fimeti]
MLGRKLTGSASFVCLRCRLQLAGVPKRPSFPPAALSSLRTPLRTSLRSIGTYRGPGRPDRLNDYDDGETSADSNLEPNLEPDHESDGDKITHNEDFASSWPLLAPAPPLSQNRVYKSRGQLVSPEKEGLSIDMLGKPGSAIVLREKRAWKKKIQEPVSDDDPAALVDPASLLLKEDDAPADEEILLNIHELRPKDTKILSEKEFTELRNTLVDGFTGAQLARYFREYETLRRLSEEETDSPEEAPWVLERQSWAPTVANKAENVEPHLVGYLTRGMAPKTRLVVKLIRECWDVANQRVLDRDGYLSLRLRDVEFSLLTLGNRRWLEGTPSAILAQVKEVRLIRESRLVSVVAPRHAAVSILDRVHEVLSNARTSDFDIDLVSPEPLEPGVLEEVGRMTNTVTRLDASGKKVVVTWIHQPKRDENWENASETVLRFLREAYGPKSRLSTALAVPDGLADQGRYLPMLNYSTKLPWQERFDKWERWTAAVSRPGTKSKAHKITIPADILPFKLNNEKAVDELASELPVDNLGGWPAEPQTGTSVTFGHVVFARQNQSSDSTSPPPQPAPELDTSLPRSFVPALPALGSLNLPNNLHEGGLWHTSTVIRFVPSPDLSPELVASAPTLELRIEADHAEIKSLTSLRAIKDTFAGDVLFPAATVDARVVQQRSFSLPGPSIEDHVPAIITFLSKSKLRPWHGKLSTPPALLGVHLPPHLFTPPPITDTDTSTPTPAATPAEESTTNAPPALVKVDYNLASIDVQRTVTAEYASLKLRYTSTQGGQGGGERSELSLEAVRVAPQLDVEPEATDVYDLVDEGVDRAAGYTSHVKNQPKAANTYLAEAQAAALAKPVKVDEFLRAASGIVNENGRLKWHAKRS